MFPINFAKCFRTAILLRDDSFKMYAKFSEKLFISYPLIHTRTFQVMRELLIKANILLVTVALICNDFFIMFAV